MVTSAKVVLLKFNVQQLLEEFCPHDNFDLVASLVAQRLKRLPAMQETWVRSLGREDPLEKEMVTHSSILAWRIPWIGGAWWATLVHGVAKSRTRLSDFTHFKLGLGT